MFELNCITLEIKAITSDENGSAPPEKVGFCYLVCQPGRKIRKQNNNKNSF